MAADSLDWVTGRHWHQSQPATATQRLPLSASSEERQQTVSHTALNTVTISSIKARMRVYRSLLYVMQMILTDKA